jgi:ATP-dependent RNA helicase DDX49/DBP8
MDLEVQLFARKKGGSKRKHAAPEQPGKRHAAEQQQQPSADDGDEQQQQRRRRPSRPQHVEQPAQHEQPAAAAGDDEQQVTFRRLGVSDWLCAVLDSLGIKQPTQVQAGCIPAVLAGRNVIGTAQTGSGKTAAFALPILQQLAHDPFGVFALVLTPTRCVLVRGGVCVCVPPWQTAVAALLKPVPVCCCCCCCCCPRPPAGSWRCSWQTSSRPLELA